jgi:DNA helicase-2/ATP-dependent DNA helicase PcrA
MQISRASLGFADKKKKRFPKKETLHYIYSRHLNTEIPIEELLRKEYPLFLDYAEAIQRIYADYTERKAARNLVDYDDLLLFWLAMLESSESLGAKIAGLYDYVLVDEYQDTNVLQARVLRAMCRQHANISVVGDDAQSIYAFRGASFRNILDFPQSFDGTTIVTLEENYRSTQPILDATNT